MALTDVEIVAILAVALIITYFIGTYWKHRILKRYAHWFRTNSPGRLKFVTNRLDMRASE